MRFKSLLITNVEMKKHTNLVYVYYREDKNIIIGDLLLATESVVS